MPKRTNSLLTTSDASLLAVKVVFKPNYLQPLHRLNQLILVSTEGVWGFLMITNVRGKTLKCTLMRPLICEDNFPQGQ